MMGIYDNNIIYFGGVKKRKCCNIRWGDKRANERFQGMKIGKFGKWATTESGGGEVIPLIC